MTATFINMGCGSSKTSKPAAVTTGARPVTTTTTVVSNAPLKHAEAVSQDAWRHPDPMKSPYPQGKPDEVISHLRDPEWIAEENIRIQQEVVPFQMEGKIIKESLAIQQGFHYTTIAK